MTVEGENKNGVGGTHAVKLNRRPVRNRYLMGTVAMV